MKILHCNNTIKLAKKISTQVNIDIINSDINKFSDGELSIKINDDLYQEDVLVIHELYPDVNENLIQLLFMINASKKRGAKRVHAIIPYFAYSRMDHKKIDQDFISASCIASLLEAAGIDTLITIDLHSSQIEGFFRIPVKNISMFELFKNNFSNQNQGNSIIVSPDIGGKIRSSSISKFLNIPLAVIYKQRDEKNNVTMSGVMGDVKDKHCILVDDIIGSGQTIIKAIDTLKHLNAKSIEVVVTHNLIGNENPNLDKILKSIDQFSVSNTIRVNNKNLYLPNVKVIDISDSIINCIKLYF
ncbi:ribose-phosphate diphosphokinase [Rickettsiales endosymbiont of Trichoplax sp. H2]|uniref:ribose-phosphate diphosphokinase n=1 Tax=Rickettsiales endosymbiont of Trichoplax sp. H2 TaxID=2021221 RepID=UPI0012B42ECD|nr:ribose-phosphate diphosphokinase [Rickettsiales endosymbiont of Trichoplax sp. H2]MSO13479.1 Ribose-phosphate pyrophosphokinase [Rickettsiales endosymbiont of Trichoplax sp. H2]